MKRDLTDWLNGLGMPDEDDVPASLRPVKVEHVKAAPDLPDELNKLSELSYDSIGASRAEALTLPVEQELEQEAESEPEKLEDNLGELAQAQELSKPKNLEDNLERAAQDMQGLQVQELAPVQESEPENLEDNNNYFDELYEPQDQAIDENIEQPAEVGNKKNKFLTEQDELQNLADELLLEDKDSYINKPEYNNYSLNDIQQLEDYVEQLENLLDEQESVLREELSKRPEQADAKDIKDVRDIKDIKEVKKEQEPREDVNGVEEQLNAVFNGANNINNNKILVKERGGEFTQQLHGALHNRKVLAIEMSELAGKNSSKKLSKKVKIAAVCAVLLSLALAGVCLTLLYLRDKAYRGALLHSHSYLYSQDVSKDVSKLEDANLNESDLNLQAENLNKNLNLNLSEDNLNLQAGNLNENLNLNLSEDNLNLRAENLNENLNFNLSEDNLNLQAENFNENLNLNLSEDSLNSRSINLNENDLNVIDNLSLDKAEAGDKFQDALDAGSLALNTKEWDDAILSFHKACNINSRDVTARIGLAGAYYGKGMYRDAMIILNETRRKFPLNATIETMRRMLRRIR